MRSRCSIELLCEIAAHGAKATAASFRSRGEYQTLLRHGYLRESGVTSSVTCLDCSEPHDAEVVYEEGQYGYYCPELGFALIAKASVQGVIADLPKLIKRLAEVFDCKRRRAQPLRAQTWRIGAVQTDHGDVMLYFQPRLRCDNHLRDLREALSSEVRW